MTWEEQKKKALIGIDEVSRTPEMEAFASEFGKWLRFDTLTCCHFDTSALIVSWLSPEELQWLNQYNESVYQRLATRVEAVGGPQMRAWLRQKTLPL